MKKKGVKYSMGFGEKMLSTQQWLIDNVNFSFSFTIFENDDYGNIHNVF
jgi:hypothetical protein